MMKWLAGKKTYLVALAIVIVVIVLVVLGKLTPTTAMTVLLFAVGSLAATFRAAMERHQDEEMEILLEIANGGAAYARHDLPGALADGEKAVEGAVKLAVEVEAAEGNVAEVKA
jgi:hypothetical protein